MGCLRSSTAARTLPSRIRCSGWVDDSIEHRAKVSALAANACMYIDKVAFASMSNVIRHQASVIRHQRNGLTGR